MKHSEAVEKILFDYEFLRNEQLIELCRNLPRKIIRWLGAHHPDNKTRKLFFEMTNVVIGEGTVINPNFVISDGYEPLLKIGKRVAISPNVTIICESEPNNSLLQEDYYVKSNLVCRKQVVIEDDVWIGSNAVILPGVTVGTKSIIGAGAVVIKDVPANTIVAGIPARIIRSLDNPGEQEK